MLQELFLQIDFNGDGTVSWDEFTTFLTITGKRSCTIHITEDYRITQRENRYCILSVLSA
jgi:EF hand